MNELQQLMDDIAEWSDSTFGEFQRNPAIVYHLQREVNELAEALDSPNPSLNNINEEFADCFMLLIDSATHFGLNAESLISYTREKLEVNKKRRWCRPDAMGVIEHDRGGEK